MFGRAGIPRGELLPWGWGVLMRLFWGRCWGLGWTPKTDKSRERCGKESHRTHEGMGGTSDGWTTSGGFAGSALQRGGAEVWAPLRRDRGSLDGNATGIGARGC